MRPNLPRSRHPPVRVADMAQLSREAELAECRQRLLAAEIVPSRPRRAPARSPSRPGSSTRTPPATDTNTSLPPSDAPPCRARTASTSASRLRSTPLATRRGGTSSTARRAPGPRRAAGASPPSRRAPPSRGARGLGDEARARVLDLDEPVIVHLEDADLVRRAEAVLERAQRAVGASRSPSNESTQSTRCSSTAAPRSSRPWSRARRGSPRRRAPWRAGSGGPPPRGPERLSPGCRDSGGS